MAILIKGADSEKPSSKATEEELAVAFSGPAIAANRMFVTIGSGGARIAFSEQQRANLPVFRSAVMLSVQDAISLKNLLADLLKEIEEKLPEAGK